MRYTIRETPAGMVRVRVHPCDGIEMGGIGNDALDAAEKAFSSLDAVARSPLGAAIPPGVREGAAVLRHLLARARKGDLDKAMKEIPAKAAAAASSVLKHIASWL